jgi:PAS domain S-box-containing protein
LNAQSLRMGLKENTFSILFESIQEGLIVVNANGEIVLCNAVVEKLFGYQPSELIGQKIEVLVPLNNRKKHTAVRESYHKAPSQRSMGSTMRLSGQKKDGTLLPVEVSLNPFKDDGVDYVVALVSDVSIRRKAEEALIEMAGTLEEKVVERTRELRQSEQLYKSIARNFPAGVISIFDASFNYLFAEGQGLYELGIETEDLIGQNYLDRLDDQTRAIVEKELKQCFNGITCSFEINLAQGTYQLNAVPLKEDGGEVNRILVVEKNITAQKRAAEKLEASLKAERELNEMKSRFVSMASHEFRTPLTTINSSATLIQKYYDKKMFDGTPKHVKRIKGAVSNLTNILNDFLSIEKLESGRVNVNWSEINLYELFLDIRDEMTGLQKEEQEIRIEGTPAYVIRSDIHLLKNIFINLISNALKYSSGPDPVVVRYFTEDKHTVVEIQDFGIGIPEEDQNKMFDRFFRAGNALNIEGTGLGLHIVTKYLELLNGKISFVSKQNVGTTFTVRLPQIN